MDKLEEYLRTPQPLHVQCKSLIIKGLLKTLKLLRIHLIAFCSKVPLCCIRAILTLLRFSYRLFLKTKSRQESSLHPGLLLSTTNTLCLRKLPLMILT